MTQPFPDFFEENFPGMFTPKTRTGIMPGSGAQLYSLPGRPTFMVQADVARIYGVKPMKLNEARKRNPKKFEEGIDYFQLEKSDIADCDIAYNGGHLPYAYTRRGAYMFATILQTPEATEQAIRIVEGFMAFERILEQKQAPPQPAPALPKTIKIEEVEYWRMKAELAELKLVQETKRQRRPFTDHERITMHKLRAQGQSIGAIARHLDRNASSVRGFFNSRGTKAQP